MNARRGGTVGRRREHGGVRLHPRLGPIAAFVAFTVPFGAAVHLLAELAGAGGSAVFTAHHLYLAAFVALAFGVLFAVVRFGRIDRRRIALLAAALPWRGRGPRFIALLTAAQLVFFVLTIVGEGSPLLGGNLLLGLLVGLVASTAGSFTIASCASRVLRAVANLVWYVAGALGVIRHDATGGRRIERAIVRIPFALFIPNRPPPAFLAIQP